MNRLEEIRKRLSEISEEIKVDGADLNALEEEVRGLKSEEKELMEKAEKREKLLNDVEKRGIVTKEFKEERKEGKSMNVNSTEYRDLYLKKLQGKELNAEEIRAYNVAGGAIATITANAIMDVVKQHAYLMERSTVIYANGLVNYYVEGVNNAATDHTENATISPAADTLVKIELAPAEITKMIQVSDAATQMSIPVFEGWLAEHLGKAIARKINNKIITAALASASEAGTAFTAQTVQALLGSVKGDDIALVCNNKVLFTQLLPLQDKGKSDIVKFDGGKATIYGRVVLLDDNLDDNTLLCGDWSKMICAVAEDINVKRDFDIDTNSNKFLGVTVFDCKVGIAEAFAKIVVAA